MSKKEQILKLLSQGKTVSQVAKETKSTTKYVYFVRWTDSNSKNKPSKITKAVTEMKATLDALDLIKDVDPVNHPPHYKTGGIETIDFIEAKDLNYRLGNVIKYVSRAGKKNSDPVEDLKKAQFYLNREIAIRERA